MSRCPVGYSQFWLTHGYKELMSAKCVVEFNSIGSSSEEGVSGLHWLYYFEGVEKLL